MKRIEFQNEQRIKNIEDRNEEKLRHLEYALEIKRSKRNARLDYEYQTRKRLLNKFEPLLFLLADYSVSAFYRIFESARAARAGDLGDKSGWLARPNYFLIYSIYRLLLPLVIFKLMQRQLTIFDLKLITSINVQYMLAHQLYFLFAADFTLAQSTPQLEYRPDSKVTYEELSNHPEIYVKQGIYLGIIDSLLESMIEEDHNTTDGISRIISFAEFQKKYFQNLSTNDPISGSAFEPFISLFLNFHPKSRPVLWRILLTQAHIYQAIKNTNEIRENTTDFKVIRLMSEEDRR